MQSKKKKKLHRGICIWQEWGAREEKRGTHVHGKEAVKEKRGRENWMPTATAASDRLETTDDHVKEGEAGSGLWDIEGVH